MDLNVLVARSVALGQLPQPLLERFEQGEFFATESVCLDFKRDHYGTEAADLAEAISDIASFHNVYGGYIVFGIEELERDVKYRVVGAQSSSFNATAIRGKMESWLRYEVPFSYQEIKLSSERSVCVLHIPKRVSGERPNEFKRRGPETKPGRYMFDANDVAVRRGDKSTLAREMADWQLVLGGRNFDEIAASLGRILPEKRSGAALEHNLPSRSVICSRFVGRQDVLTDVWAWLNDEFQYAKVIAGEGGKGKTSVAYEFSTQVAHLAPWGIERIVWLTAKKRQFSGIENTWKQMPETHFTCFRSMLAAIGEKLGYTGLEMSEASDAELRGLVRQEIGIQPTLFVLDDLDSLSLDDQRKALEFAQQSGSEKVRFLLTTRSNSSYSSDAAITLKGLSGSEYGELVEMLCDRYKVALNKGGIEELERATAGSPLLTDSILRVVRRGNSLRKAIDEWKGHPGEDARNAVLGREISQLSREAKRALLCLALLGQCSKAELMSASGLLEFKLEDVLEELQSLFIVSAPKIIESEPRFEIGTTAAILVLAKRSDLAGDHVAVEKRVKELRSGVRESAGQLQSKKVAIVISQALALVKAGKYESALATVNAGLKSEKNHPDLLLFKARLLVLEARPPLYEDARVLLQQAYARGTKKHILFDLQHKCERELGFGPGVIEVAENALKEFPSEEALWCGRKAEGYVLNGLSRTRNRDFDHAFSELEAAAKELYFAAGRASVPEQASLREFMLGVHDEMLGALANSSQALRSDAVSLLREMLDREDHRRIVLEAAVGALEIKLGEVSRKGVSTAARERFEANRHHLLDLLRNAGQWAASSYQAVREMRIP